MQACLVIHCEPHPTPWQEEKWPHLVSIIAACNARGAKATIALTAPWADWISANPNILSVVRSWAMAGHEIGYHHHGKGTQDLPAGWDGYSDLPTASGDSDYLGPVAEALTKVDTLVPAVSVTFACMSDQAIDWQPGLQYNTLNGPIVSSPVDVDINGMPVKQLTYDAIIRLDLAAVQAAVAASSENTVSIVMHAEHGNPDEFPAIMPELLDILDWYVEQSIPMIGISTAIAAV